MKASQTKSSAAGTLICGVGRTQVSQREVEKWCDRSTAVPQTAYSVVRAA